MKGLRIYTTSAGIQIGSGFTAPLRVDMDKDAIRVQRALLQFPTGRGKPRVSIRRMFSSLWNWHA